MTQNGNEGEPMFGKDEKTKTIDPVKPSPTPMTEKKGGAPAGSGFSVLGPDAKFDGKLETSSNVQIDGFYKGELQVRGTLMVGKEGKVDAEVNAERVVVHGRLEGKVTAGNKIELMEGSAMIGDINAPSLVIQDDVEFEGTCRTGKKAKGVQGA